MASRDNFSGMFAYLMVLLFVPWVLFVVLDGTQGTALATAVTALVVLGLLATAILGVRSKGAAFFGMFGEFISQLTGGDDASKSKTGKSPKVPRPPTYWTNKLVEAVGGVCEVQSCRKVTHLQVHHIKNHAQGGTNSLTNLIVVCPHHHQDCGRGAINTTRQKAIIGRPNRFKDSTFPGRWKTSVLDKEKAKANTAEGDGILAGW